MLGDAPIVRDLVLLGGGHSHVLLIKRWAMKPIAGVRVTLISEDEMTPYSGMLPGFIAGHYSMSDMHIDLSRLSRWAGIRFIRARANALDPEAKLVKIINRPAISYDVLSVDTGSTPDLDSVPGARENVIPVKPIANFRAHWESLFERQTNEPTVRDIGVVGSGVGGFELLLAMQYAFANQTVGGSTSHRFHWIVRGEAPMRNRPAAARKIALEECLQKGISVHTGFDVVKVRDKVLFSAAGSQLKLDDIVWCTGAVAPDWIAQAGFETDRRGFFATNQYLQTISHDSVFAVGDVGTQVDTPSDKAGVFAVRQAPVLFANLQRWFQSKPLKPYRPQKHILNLMALGRRSAIATRGNLTVSGDWVWQWKDRIDSKFMHRFTDLPVRTMNALGAEAMPDALRDEIVQPEQRCGGCAAKLPANVLKSVLGQLASNQGSSMLPEPGSMEDAARVVSDKKIIQSVDQFRAMLDDPWTLGRIGALHAMSDIFAMGANVHSAQILVGLPYAGEEIQHRELLQLMSGIMYEFEKHQCALLGGHSSESAELSLGFVINGETIEVPEIEDDSSSSLTLQSNLAPGDRLILTKPLGNGIVMSADMKAQASGDTVRACIDSMLQSNAAASEIFLKHGSRACTDVTGFGLIGHLLNLLTSSGLSAKIWSNSVPLLDGVIDLAGHGIRSSLALANRVFVEELDSSSQQVTASGSDLAALRIELMLDPQTSGGLLAAVTADSAESCVADLRAAGYEHAAVIGICDLQSESDSRLLVLPDSR